MITNNFVLQIEKQIWVFFFKKKILTTYWFWKSWDCLEIEFDQSVWDRIFCCIDFIFHSVTSVILVSIERNLCVFAEKWCVFLRGSRSAFLVLVCWPREVCVLRGSRSLSWLCCEWSRFDWLVEIPQWFLRRLYVALGLEWTSINICVHSLYP